MLTTLLFQIQHSWQLSLLDLPSLLFFGDPTSTVTSSSDSSSWYTSTAQSGPLLLMHHLHPIFAFKPLIPFPPTSFLLPLHPNHRLMLLAVSLYLLLLPPLDSLRVLQWNAGRLRARSTELLLFLLSHPVDLICIQESYSCKQNYVTICNLLSQDSIIIYTAYTEHHYI